MRHWNALLPVSSLRNIDCIILFDTRSMNINHSIWMTCLLGPNIHCLPAATKKWGRSCNRTPRIYKLLSRYTLIQAYMRVFTFHLQTVPDKRNELDPSENSNRWRQHISLTCWVARRQHSMKCLRSERSYQSRAIMRIQWIWRGRVLQIKL